jgi:hypothetical protein
VRCVLDVDEAWPVLCLREAGDGDEWSVEVPDRLAKRLLDARAAEEEAANEIARWVKYSGDEEAKLVMRPLIARLPAPEERKKGRKR